jgi:hypothetical protein
MIGTIIAAQQCGDIRKIVTPWFLQSISRWPIQEKAKYNANTEEKEKTRLAPAPVATRMPLPTINLFRARGDHSRDVKEFSGY